MSIERKKRRRIRQSARIATRWSGLVLRSREVAALCAMVAVLCVIAQVRPPKSVFWVSPAQSLECGVSAGQLWIWSAGKEDFRLYQPGWNVSGRTPARWIPEVRIDREYVITRWGLFGYSSSVVNGLLVSLPLWLVGCVLAVPLVVRVRRVRLRKPGHCVCGYHIDGLRCDRCPECGQLLDDVTAPRRFR